MQTKTAPCVSRLPGLSALRALASLLVLVQHALYFTAVTGGVPYETLIRAPFGMAGVCLFFTISGFVITLKRHRPIGEFLMRRALRIYPPFWTAVAISLALHAAVGVEAHGSAWALLLLPARSLNETMHIPYWTLIFEVCFYALAAGVFALRLRDQALAVCLVVWIGAALFFEGYTGPLGPIPGEWVLLSHYVMFFAAGALVCLYRDTLRSLPTLQTLAAVIVFYLPAGALWGVSDWRVAWWLLCLAASFGLIVVLTIRVTSLPIWLVAFGEASYGLYLLHMPLMAALSAVLTGTALAASRPGTLAVFFLIPLVLATMYGLTESRLHEMLARRLNRETT